LGLILAGADWLDSKAWTNVRNWVEAGGVLVVLSDKPIADIDSDSSLWKKQAVEAAPVIESHEQELSNVWKAGTKMMGKGKILTVNMVGLTKEQRAIVAGRLCFDAGAKLVDGKIDGILSTRFDDKILYFNTTTEGRKLDVTYRESDFPEGSPRPAKMKQSLDIPARTIIDIPLK